MAAILVASLGGSSFVLTSIFPDFGEQTAQAKVMVLFEERLVKYDFGELDEISLAYAITIHKSQGSEFAAVVIPLATQHYMLLQRNLIYTGITRGKRLLIG
jgi:exodeoxyribonuclease V alpha subunit